MSYLSTLSKDVLYQTALYMSYPDILTHCQSDLKTICNNNKFWKDKFTIDFPKTKNELPDPRYRYQYEYYKNKFKDDIVERINNDPISNKLKEEKWEIDHKKSKLENQYQKLDKQIGNQENEIEDKTNQKLNSLRAVVLKYRTPFYQEFSIEDDWEIDEIELQDTPGYLYGYRMQFQNESQIITYILITEEGKKKITNDNRNEIYTNLIDLYPSLEDFKQAYNYPYDDLELLNPDF